MIFIVEPFLIHNHTENSNFRLFDSVAKTTDLLDTAVEIGLSGICITDHEALSSHVTAYKHINKHKDRFKDFKLGYGNEIYLVDKVKTENLVKENERVQYYHFLLVAKNNHGHKGIRELSTRAHQNGYTHRGMQRVPLYKSDLAEVMADYKGDIIASSACVGGEIPQLLLEINGYKERFNKKTEKLELYQKKLDTNLKKKKQKELDGFIEFLLNMFGDDFYLELQPADREIQTVANKLLYDYGKEKGIKCIVTTDTHYIYEDKYNIQEAFLTAQDGQREVLDFYSTTFLMNREKLGDYFEDKEMLDDMINNTMEIHDKIEEVEFGSPLRIPTHDIPKFKEPTIKTDYEYINKMMTSEYEVDRFYMRLVQDGIESKDIPHDLDTVLDRVNTECRELWLLSKGEMRMSSYFTLTNKIIDLIWEVSLVAPSRGSACCFYTNYLLDITQVDAIAFELPHWRFLSVERGAVMPDIDIDTQSDKRGEIMELLYKEFGHDKVLSIGAFKTEASRSAVRTACRGLGVPTGTAMNMSNMVDQDDNVTELLQGNAEKGIKPNEKFKNRVDKYEGLEDMIVEIHDLISGCTQHAGGVVIFNDGFIEEGTAMMKTPKGIEVTQFNDKDTEFLGGMKIDLLSINALTEIRIAMDFLLADDMIEWQGSLKETFFKYFHPDALELEEQEMFDMLHNGDVHNVFQFSTDVGTNALREANPQTFDELALLSSLMRLTVGSGEEQPIAKFVRHRANMNEWYDDMAEYGLNEEEIKIMREHLDWRYGICDTQEGLMLMVMDENVAGYTLEEANYFRKNVGKQNQKALQEEKDVFFNKGRDLGAREVFLDYIWNEQLKLQFDYSFSLPHVVGYTFIAFMQMNICYRYHPIYWQTASLCVISGSDEDDGQIDYGKMASAMGNLKGKIVSPDINSSEMSFVPDVKNEKIMMGIKPISGIGAIELKKIFEHRPFDSFDDFYERMCLPVEQEHLVKPAPLLSPIKTITLIKSGALDNISGVGRRELMIDFVSRVTGNRDKLTMANIPFMLQNDLLDKKRFKGEINLYNFRGAVTGANKTMNKKIEKYFLEHYIDDVEYTFKDGVLEIDEASMEKYYDKNIVKLQEYIGTEECINKFNQKERQLLWIERCSGRVESWEMETTSFYTDKHELDYAPLDKHFDIAKFYDLPPEPKMSHNGYRNVYEDIYEIAGTVIQKDKSKGNVTVLTQHGVVTVKMWDNVYSKYDESFGDGKGANGSWLERGTLLVLVGFRRGEQFFVNYRDSHHNTGVYRINAFDSEKIAMSTR